MGGAVPLEVTPSTLDVYRGRLRATVTTQLSSEWAGAMMGRAVEQALVKQLIPLLPPFLGMGLGAALTASASNSVLFGFALAVGGALGLIAPHTGRLIGVSAEGAGTSLKIELEAAVRSADEARKLAQLSVEAAMIIANRPSGVIGGGFVGANDGLRKLIGDRLLELGLDKKEGSHFARFDDPHIARRIIQHIILKAVNESARGGEGRARELVVPLLGADAPRDPQAIEALLGKELLQDPAVATAVDFYRQWHHSEAKLYFFIENAEQFEDSAKRSGSASTF